MLEMSARPFSDSRREVIARRALIALVATASVAAVSGTLIYCYPSTLGAWRGPIVLIHELSGDAAILCSGIYLLAHLMRVWPLRRLRLSWWSGLAATAVWGVAALSGVYGQLKPLESGTWLWHAHVWTSLFSVVIGCLHGVWGLRPRCHS